MKLTRKETEKVFFNNLRQGAKFFFNGSIYLKYNDKEAIELSRGDVILMDNDKVEPVEIREIIYKPL